MITFNQVTKRYSKGFEALHRVSFEMHSGEMAFLTGHSGAGKTTILKLISLVEKSTQGEITVADYQLSKLPLPKIPYYRRELGLIFQNPHLLFDRNIFENVAMPLVFMNVTQSEINRRVRAALAKVGLLAKEKCMPATLSAGEQQRVSIARAVVHRPKILLADEPTGNLDAKLAFEVMRLFEQFNQIGVTVLVASHDLPLIKTFNKRIIMLDQGSLVGSPQ